MISKEHLAYLKETAEKAMAIDNGQIVATSKFKEWAEHIAAADPETTLELIAYIEQLEKEVDWLAEKACQCAEASTDECFICIQNRNMPTPNDWREAAERAVR